MSVTYFYALDKREIATSIILYFGQYFLDFVLIIKMYRSYWLLLVCPIHKFVVCVGLPTCEFTKEFTTLNFLQPSFPTLFP